MVLVTHLIANRQYISRAEPFLAPPPWWSRQSSNLRPRCASLAQRAASLRPALRALGKAANPEVCRFGFAELPTVESEIRARPRGSHRCERCARGCWLSRTDANTAGSSSKATNLRASPLPASRFPWSMNVGSGELNPVLRPGLRVGPAVKAGSFAASITSGTSNVVRSLGVESTRLHSKTAACHPTRCLRTGILACVTARLQGVFHGNDEWHIVYSLDCLRSAPPPCSRHRC